MTSYLEGVTQTIASEPEPGERHAHELADKIRLLAATDPQLAQDLVDQLMAGLDRATGGAFREHLRAAARTDAEPQVNGAGPAGRERLSMPPG